MSEPEYRTLNPRCKIAQRLKYGLIFLVVLVLAVVSISYRTPEVGNIPSYLLGAFTLCMAVVTIVFPEIYHRHYRYIINADKVDIRKGVIFLRHTVVPIERIHQVEVTSGPVSRMLGLAHVVVTTAGGNARIEYLEKDVAESIAEDLNRTVDAILRARKA